MKVGVFLLGEREGGGIYQYALAMVSAVTDLRDQFDHLLAVESGHEADVGQWAKAGWEVVALPKSRLRAGTRRLLASIAGESVVRRAAGAWRRGALSSASRDSRKRAWLSQQGKALRSRGVDVMLYPAPTRLAFEAGVPYVMAIHDVQHRLQPEFPEVSAGGELAAREYLFRNGVENAEAILVDSAIGREDVLRFYGESTTPDRVHVLPFVPPPYLEKVGAASASDIVQSLGLPPRYLLFPAQFWPHKNHVRVVRALGALRRGGLETPVVMTGSSKGALRGKTLAEVRHVATEEGVSDLVHILGYVDNSRMSSLYAAATAVVLPTFFGPTNIPVLEGWAMGVPVLTSDIRGIREQCEDAALLVNPRSVQSIADGIDRVWADDSLREHLIAAGVRKATSYTEHSFRDRLAGVLEDVRKRLALS